MDPSAASSLGVDLANKTPIPASVARVGDDLVENVGIDVNALLNESQNW